MSSRRRVGELWYSVSNEGQKKHCLVTIDKGEQVIIISSSSGKRRVMYERRYGSLELSSTFSRMQQGTPAPGVRISGHTRWHYLVVNVRAAEKASAEIIVLSTNKATESKKWESFLKPATPMPSPQEETLKAQILTLEAERDDLRSKLAKCNTKEQPPVPSVSPNGIRGLLEAETSERAAITSTYISAITSLCMVLAEVFSREVNNFRNVRYSTNLLTVYQKRLEDHAAGLGRAMRGMPVIPKLKLSDVPTSPVIDALERDTLLEAAEQYLMSEMVERHTLYSSREELQIASARIAELSTVESRIRGKLEAKEEECEALNEELTTLRAHEAAQTTTISKLQAELTTSIQELMSIRSECESAKVDQQTAHEKVQELESNHRAHGVSLENALKREARLLSRVKAMEAAHVAAEAVHEKLKEAHAAGICMAQKVAALDKEVADAELRGLKTCEEAVRSIIATSEAEAIEALLASHLQTAQYISSQSLLTSSWELAIHETDTRAAVANDESSARVLLWASLAREEGRHKEEAVRAGGMAACIVQLCSHEADSRASLITEESGAAASIWTSIVSAMEAAPDYVARLDTEESDGRITVLAEEGLARTSIWASLLVCTQENVIRNSLSSQEHKERASLWATSADSRTQLSLAEETADREHYAHQEYEARSALWAGLLWAVTELAGAERTEDSLLSEESCGRGDVHTQEHTARIAVCNIIIKTMSNTASINEVHSQETADREHATRLESDARTGLWEMLLAIRDENNACNAARTNMACLEDEDRQGLCYEEATARDLLLASMIHTSSASTSRTLLGNEEHVARGMLREQEGIGREALWACLKEFLLHSTTVGRLKLQCDEGDLRRKVHEAENLARDCMWSLASSARHAVTEEGKARREVSECEHVARNALLLRWRRWVEGEMLQAVAYAECMDEKLYESKQAEYGTNRQVRELGKECRELRDVLCKERELHIVGQQELRKLLVGKDERHKEAVGMVKELRGRVGEMQIEAARKDDMIRQLQDGLNTLKEVDRVLGACDDYDQMLGNNTSDSIISRSRALKDSLHEKERLVRQLTAERTTLETSKQRAITKLTQTIVALETRLRSKDDEIMRLEEWSMSQACQHAQDIEKRWKTDLVPGSKIAEYTKRAEIAESNEWDLRKEVSLVKQQLHDTVKKYEALKITARRSASSHCVKTIKEDPAPRSTTRCSRTRGRALSFTNAIYPDVATPAPAEAPAPTGTPVPFP